MKLMDYAYPLADEPTVRTVAIEPTWDETERYIIRQLEALFCVPCPRGTMPGTTITYAEQRALQAVEVLNDLQTWRNVRYDTRNKIQKKRRWAHERNRLVNG